MRALIIILGSLGCGDAATAGDPQADTLGHVFAANPKLQLPGLFSLGLWKILTADVFDPRSQHTTASYGRMRPRTVGKNSTSGHWEIAGVILDEPFATFNTLPQKSLKNLEQEAQVEFLANRRLDESLVLEQYGKEHLRTGRPILFIAADFSVRIAAHPDRISPSRLHKICTVLRRHANDLRIERIVACPFSGAPGAFAWMEPQREHPMVPPRTILNAIADTGREVHGVGKIRALFAGSGITDSRPASSNAEAVRAISDLWDFSGEGLIFANLPDFDALQEPADYARALVAFDQWLSDFLPRMDGDDLLILTADQGHPPSVAAETTPREDVPLMIVHEGLSVPLGTRKTFADIAASLGEFFHLREKWPTGTSFLRHARGG